MENIYEQLINNGINERNILLNEPMSKHISFKTGGSADIYIKATSVDEIKKVIDISNKNRIPLFILGNGTNVLIKDEGFRGIVLQVKLENIIISQNIVTLGAGVKNAVLAHMLMESSLTGFEFAAGIPGTIGGAVKMNAGAYGNEMKDIVQEITYLDEDGNEKILKNSECDFSYRHSIFSKIKGVILQVTLKLEKGNKENILEKMNDLLEQRKAKQPLEYPSAGSTFKRGEDFVTAKLIDECGLKGYQIGGAQVSEKHAGFIINRENATSKDIINLIEHVKKVVKDKTGKEINLEIEII